MQKDDAIKYALKNIEAVEGEIWECGVFEGDTAVRMKGYMEELGVSRDMRLFDTFEGMPYSGPNDVHPVGCMKADVGKVKIIFSNDNDVFIHQGIMPDSFKGLEEKKIALVIIDVDNYDSVKGCLEFIYPRVEPGGWILLDDYNCGACPGAKLATDEFLKDKPENIFYEGGQNPLAFFVKDWDKTETMVIS